MKLGNQKKMMLASTLTASLSGFSAINNIQTHSQPDKEMSFCSKYSIQKLNKLYVFNNLEPNLPKLKEDYIHAERIEVCFVELGIPSYFVPLNSSVAGIENL